MARQLLLVILTLLTVVYVSASRRQKELAKVSKVVRGFSAVDTNYIEPQRYNFTVMLQTTFNYDIYRLRSYSGQSVLFSPDVLAKLGPYIGWRWVFLGYTFDLKNLNFTSKKKQEFEFSIYSSQVGVDLFYRRTGSDYKIRNVYMGKDADVYLNDNISFDGLNVGITGANLYYIFNHKRFSYPAAFSQSTIQRKSCGSWMAGIGYTQNSLELDYEKLKATIEGSDHAGEAKLDSGFMFSSVNYLDVSLSVGYAYNYVFSKRWLLCASASAALAYKHTKTKGSEESEQHGFQIDNFNMDAIGRFGLVYNNMRWYSGLSAILHCYNYRKQRFAANNIFGTINVYIGYNFGLKKEYRRKRK